MSFWDAAFCPGLRRRSGRPGARVRSGPPENPRPAESSQAEYFKFSPTSRAAVPFPPERTARPAASCGRRRAGLALKRKAREDDQHGGLAGKNAKGSAHDAKNNIFIQIGDMAMNMFSQDAGFLMLPWFCHGTLV